MHPLPAVPHTVCFGQTRKVDRASTISVGSAIYSVPSSLVEERVWARAYGSELVVVHVDSPDGPREVARHALTTPRRPSIKDEHYPPRPARLSAHREPGRGRSRSSSCSEKPNELQSWDITKLKGPAKWTYYYLYVILDVFSRYVVGWTVQDREDSHVAQALIAQVCDQQQIQSGQLTVHADRGSSMTSKPVAFLLADFGVGSHCTSSVSR